MNANDRYEARAARFYKETGMMAPGKDEPPGFSAHTWEERMEAWNKWVRHLAPRSDEQD